MEQIIQRGFPPPRRRDRKPAASEFVYPEVANLPGLKFKHAKMKFE
jgi:hypothetical protein